jgi:hypothetical protein
VSECASEMSERKGKPDPPSTNLTTTTTTTTTTKQALHHTPGALEATASLLDAALHHLHLHLPHTPTPTRTTSPPPMPAPAGGVGRGASSGGSSGGGGGVDGVRMALIHATVMEAYAFLLPMMAGEGVREGEGEGGAM